VAQLADKVVLSPTQILDGLAIALVGAAGIGVTVTVLAKLAVLSHPVRALTHFAVYIVVRLGETIIDVPVCPFDHDTVSGETQPVAVNVVFWPLHIAALTGVIMGVDGCAFIVKLKVLFAGVTHDTAPVDPQDAL
jgi:hypothetical protein